MAEEYKHRFQDLDACVFVDYQQIETRDINGFRQELGENGIDMMVLRNSMARRAFRELDKEHLNEFIEGPTAIIYSEDSTDPVTVAKEVVSFQEENEDLDVLGGAVDRKALDPSEVEALSELPGKQELLSQFAQAMAGPVQGLATGMNDALSRFARGLKELSDQEDSE